MLSKKQADVASDELLREARERRERRAERNVRYPELLKLPIAGRVEALRQARDRAWRHPAVIGICFGDLVLGVFVVRALWQDQPYVRELILATVGVFLIQQIVHRRLTRKLLRLMIGEGQN